MQKTPHNKCQNSQIFGITKNTNYANYFDVIPHNRFYAQKVETETAPITVKAPFHHTFGISVEVLEYVPAFDGNSWPCKHLVPVLHFNGATSAAYNDAANQLIGSNMIVVHY